MKLTFRRYRYRRGGTTEIFANGARIGEVWAGGGKQNGGHVPRFFALELHGILWTVGDNSKPQIRGSGYGSRSFKRRKDALAYATALPKEIVEHAASSSPDAAGPR